MSRKKKENYFCVDKKRDENDEGWVTVEDCYVDLMVQNNENKRIIRKNDGIFKLSSQFTNLIDFTGVCGWVEGGKALQRNRFSFLINKIVIDNSPFCRKYVKFIPQREIASIVIVWKKKLLDESF